MAWPRLLLLAALAALLVPALAQGAPAQAGTTLAPVQVLPPDQAPVMEPPAGDPGATVPPTTPSATTDPATTPGGTGTAPASTPGTGTSPGTDPGTTPGTGPGGATDPGTTPGTGPATVPPPDPVTPPVGTDPGTQPPITVPAPTTGPDPGLVVTPAAVPPPEAPKRPDLVGLTSDLAGQAAPDRVKAPANPPTGAVVPPKTPPAAAIREAAKLDPDSPPAPAPVLGPGPQGDFVRGPLVLGSPPPAAPSASKRPRRVAPTAKPPSDGILLTTRIAPQDGIAPTGAASLLAALASYVLPGSGTVPPTVLLLLLAQVAILLALARPPRRSIFEIVAGAAAVRPRFGHRQAVERPG